MLKIRYGNFHIIILCRQKVASRLIAKNQLSMEHRNLCDILFNFCQERTDLRSEITVEHHFTTLATQKTDRYLGTVKFLVGLPATPL